MADKILLEEEQYQATGQMSSIASYCQDLFDEFDSSSYRDRKLDEIDEGRKDYDGDRPDKTFPWEDASNKSMGLTSIAVDNLEPRVFNKLISEDDFIQVHPTCEDDIEKIDNVREFMHWMAHSSMKIRKRLKPIVHNLLRDGTVYVLSRWYEKDITVRERGTQPVFKDPEGNEVMPPPEMLQAGDPEQVIMALMQMGITPAGDKEGYTERSELDFRCDVDALKIEDTYWPDHNDDWEKQPFFRKIYPKLGDLVKGQEKGVYKNITNALVKGTKRDSTEDEDRLDIQYSDYGQHCELLECYLIWKDEWRIVTFSMDNNWQEVRNQPLKDVYWYDHKPIRRFRIYPKSTEQLGTGIPHKIRYFSKGVNDLYNAMIDNATVEVTPFGFYNQSSTGMASLKNLKVKPGAILPIPKDANMFFPSIGVKSPVFESFINLLMTFFERTLSLMDYTAGTRSSTTGAGGDTASGLQMILQEGNIKHNYTGETIQDEFADLLTDCLSLYAQYMPMDAKIRIFERNDWLFKPVDIHSIQGRYDIRIDVSDASSNTMTNRNDTLALLGNLQGAPFINQIQLAEDVLKAFGKKATDKYISPQFGMILRALAEAPELGEQLQQVIQQYMQQKQAQEQEAQVRDQAISNIQRQEIQRGVERETGFENKKIVDQANESFKRKETSKIIEMLGGV